MSGAAIIAKAVAIGRREAAKYRVDTYQIMRPVRTPDDEGGWTEVPGVVESGGCILTMGATRPEERALAEQMASTVPVIVRDMPYTTVLTADDTLVINGDRTLNVIGVLRTEAVNVAVTAVCEERG